MQALKKLKVFLTGGDGIGWAIDEDLRLTALALEGIVDFVDLEESEVVHLAWWEDLNLLPPDKLKGKWIVCHVPGEPFRYFALPRHRHAVPMISTWIARNSQARSQLKSVGIRSELVPYAIDTSVFRPLSKNDSELAQLKSDYGIPSNSYIIGSFQRDTEGQDLAKPKLVKGPDIFLEILTRLKQRGSRIHALLAGPRRHWLIKQFRSRDIPFTYVGNEIGTDDIRINSLSRDDLNILYNLVDLYVVSSRSEGGPHSILEAGASKTKILSSRVGLAADVLEPFCIFDNPLEASDIIERDIEEDHLSQFVDGLYERVLDKHSPTSSSPVLKSIYTKIASSLGKTDASTERIIPIKTPNPFISRKESTSNAERKFTICLWHSFYEPPYGGGNQFMMALKKALLGLGVDVRENELHESIDAYILNSVHFDVERFLEFSKSHRLNVVHRIDGPIHLIRGYDREKDEQCFNLNQKFASATVLQSAWTFQRIVDMGYKPVSPTIIRNAVDDEIFNSTGRVKFDRYRKARLISTSWSNNPRKGGPVYKWIEDNLDWDRFDYSFVGNVSEKFEHIRHIPAVPSQELADLLRNHDIYITASKNDPCSNALIEALSCGLPSLYYEDGGHPELVSAGGLPFRTEDELLEQLENMVDNYEMFQSLITVSRLNEVASKYLSIAREIAS